MSRWQGDEKVHARGARPAVDEAPAGPRNGPSPNGVSWRRRAYIADWMAGHVGTKVRLRYLPHFDGRIEVFCRGLGTASGQRLSRRGRDAGSAPGPVPGP
ncbi:Mu transposase C-terminal domain-containing protein [Streptomyces sp. ISL-44]|uniref:Mu transposase C-terminal domain-containing protein n=1 Tax=Streptomyces sp. ISL-44 TaxID=2819184 RepID=UPI001BE613EA|nr:Mu transposase C-terminal domain-containing protein [Streptomyces sp. ISL-44]MBT2545253.1 Mu transposase C-terminal domain-containing protein [Streptomyces sp. ISL-44]